MKCFNPLVRKNTFWTERGLWSCVNIAMGNSNLISNAYFGLNHFLGILEAERGCVLSGKHYVLVGIEYIQSKHLRKGSHWFVDIPICPNKHQTTDCTLIFLSLSYLVWLWVSLPLDFIKSQPAEGLESDVSTAAWEWTDWNDTCYGSFTGKLWW